METQEPWDHHEDDYPPLWERGQRDLRLQGHWFRDPRIRRAGPGATLLYLNSILHAQDNHNGLDGSLLDVLGFEAFLTDPDDRDAAAEALVRVGLWEEVIDGWIVIGDGV